MWTSTLIFSSPYSDLDWCAVVVVVVVVTLSCRLSKLVPKLLPGHIEDGHFCLSVSTP